MINVRSFIAFYLYGVGSTEPRAVEDSAVGHVSTLVWRVDQGFEESRGFLRPWLSFRPPACMSDDVRLLFALGILDWDRCVVVGKDCEDGVVW